VVAFGLTRVQALFSGSRDLAAIARRDPEHLPERLALFAVHRLGEPSRRWARDALADGADPGVVATTLRHRAGRVARIDGVRYRNTRGPFHPVSIAGVLVALSLVIAITVAVNRG
jgi:hypothetical protein